MMADERTSDKGQNEVLSCIEKLDRRLGRTMLRYSMG
jgi:hypothetical protein